MIHIAIASTTGSSTGHQPVVKLRTIVRRVIDADNSCLFNALGYLMVRDKKQMNHVYRQMIASEIQGDPIKYSTEVLEGKSNEEYATWIMNADKWGGEIEMSIFPKHLGVEIAAGNYLLCYCVLPILTSLPHSFPSLIPPLAVSFEQWMYKRVMCMYTEKNMATRIVCIFYTMVGCVTCPTLYPSLVL